jgi:hypothetical protein
MALAPPTKIKYLTNKDLLEEIHRSKITYCSYIDAVHTRYDFIVADVKSITPDRIEEARKKRLADMQTIERKSQLLEGIKDPKITSSMDDVPIESIVIRVMTYDHIPINPEKIDKAKTIAERHIRCNFPPFQHYVMEDGHLRCVLKSHWKGGLENGHFSKDHGKMTNSLAMMFMKLVDRYGHRGNWRGYTYIDEMKSQALLQLSQVGLQFDESRSETPNPFAYYTQTITNSFMRILNIEKKNQTIRDDILIMHGATPSWTRQTEDAIKQQGATGT